TVPGQRAKTAAAVDATTRTTLGPDRAIVSAPTSRWRPAPRGLRHPAGHRAGLGGLWLAHAYRLGGATHPRPPPAGRGDRTPGPHPVAGRSGFARSGGPVPGASQLRMAPREPPPTVAGSRSHERSWRSHAVAAVDPGDGGGPHRPCVDAA